MNISSEVPDPLMADTPECSEGAALTLYGVRDPVDVKCSQLNSYCFISYS